MPPPRIRPSLFFTAHPIRHHTSIASRLHLHRIRTQALTTLPPHTRSSTSFPGREAWRIFTSVVKIYLWAHLFITYIGFVEPTNGISMVPTIPHSYGSTPLILVSRLHRRGRNIAVGDVITYDTPGRASARGCKRVVGMPGDFVSVVSTGREDEDLLKEDDEGDWANVKADVIRVPEGHVWLAGDNLEWSRDSRTFGPVPLNMVSGKVLAVMWPWSDRKWLGGKEGLSDVKEGEHELRLMR